MSIRLLLLAIRKIKEWLELDYMESTCDTDAHAQLNYVTNSSAVGNEIPNGGFESFTGSVPDSWVQSAGGHLTPSQETTIKYSGSSSLKMVSVDANSADFHQYLEDGDHNIAYWQGKTIKISCMVRASRVNMARVFVYDGVGYSSGISVYHPGDSTWVRMEQTFTISPSATTVYVAIGVASPQIGDAIYFDDFYLVEGNYFYSLQSYSGSGAGNITQGTYSLKIEAAQTDSLNKTLTRTISPAKDLSSKTQIKYDVKASRTGSNFKLGFHDSGGTTTEHTPNIITANTWQTETVDISGVSDANKDAINQFIITILNADAANTIRIDNVRYA
jgi:hypothetical protein